jgi:hypothetical protein
VDEQHLNKFNGDKPPIPIPPVDRAWSGMEKLLSKELPVSHATPAGYSRWLSTGAVVVATVIIVITLSEKRNTDQRNNTIAVTEVTREPVTENTTEPVTEPYTTIPSDTSGNISASEIAIKEQKTNSIHPSSSKDQKAVSISAETDHQRKERQKTALINKIRKVRYKNKQSPASETTSASKVKSASETALVSETHHQSYIPSTHETKEQTSASIDLSMLPLHKENWKALEHRDMQISPNPSVKEKMNQSNSWSLWVQLNVPLPLYGTKYYATGPKGNNAVYRNIIPSLRLERAIGKSALSIDLHAYNATVLPVKKVDTLPGDSTMTAVNRPLVKQFGPEILLQYHYPVYENLHVSAGLGASWWRKAIIGHAKDSLPSVTNGAATDADWKNYARFVFTANIEVYYDLREWQIGLRTALPLNKYTSDKALFANKRLQVELLLRRRISWPSFFR